MKTLEKDKIWEKVLAQIQLNLNPINFTTWFGKTRISKIKENEVVIEVPNAFIKEWLEQKFYLPILKILKSIDPSFKRISFEISPKKEDFKLNLIETQTSQLDLLEEKFSLETGLTKKYTFENYVVGSFNELPFAAAQAIIKKPGKVYNPLFIYGGVGLGKTHLLQAIGNEILKLDKTKKVKYVTSEFLVSQIVNALRKKEIEILRKSYQKLDVLIVDDVQILSGKEKSQEEFFFIFNYLYHQEKQIVISSDRPPREISYLTERLKSRFEGGMIADISEPDFESRLAILKVKMKEKGEVIKQEILEYIAHNVKKNIRELEGALNICVLWQKEKKKILELEKAKEILKKFTTPPKNLLNPKNVVKVICDFYQIKESDLLSNSRKYEILKPRQVAMFFMKKYLNLPFSSIARVFGGKDHTTVIHAVQKVEREYGNNVNFRWEIDCIKSRLYS